MSNIEYSDFDYHKINSIHSDNSGVILNYAAASALDNNNLILKGCTDTRIYMTNKNNRLQIGDNVKIDDCGITFKGKNNTIIIDDKCNLNRIYFHLKGDNNTIKIGKRTEAIGQCWGDFSIVCNGENKQVEIGEDCLISGNIIIRNCDGHSIINKDGEILKECTNISIGNHVWICENARIYKHACLANNSIVAGGSIVTKQFKKDNIVIGGNPAHIIKELEGTWAR